MNDEGDVPGTPPVTAEPGGDQMRLRGQLRAELAAFVNAAGARRVIAPVFHLGTPGGHRGRDQIAVPEGSRFEAGLRADVIERCLSSFDLCAGPTPLPWLTRGGDLAAQDGDVAWAAASREAFARHAVPFPGFFVVTRKGWLNIVTSEATTQQIRRRRTRSAG